MRAGSARWCRERVPAHGRLCGLRMVFIRHRARGARPQRLIGAPLAGKGEARSAPSPRDDGEDRMTPRRRRLVLVLGILAGVAIAGALALTAFRQNVMFFFDP